MNRRLAMGALLAAFGSLSIGPAAQAADTYPDRPIHLIVGFPAGTTTDILARIYAEKMGKLLNATFVVENMPGAASNNAAATAAHSAPDGYTLFVASNANTTGMSLYKDLRYKIPEDFEPISQLASAPPVLAVSNQLGVNSVQELIALAKKKPGEVLFGSAGVGTGPYMAAEVLEMLAGIKMTHVPYKGTNLALTDLMTGRISVLFAPLPSVSGVAKSGKIKLLASTPAKRPSVAPDLPTIAESGVKGFDVTLWFGLVASKGTPRPILVKLANAVQATGKSEDVKARLALAGGEPMTLTLDDFGVFLKNDVPKWAAIVKHAGLVPQ